MIELDLLIKKCAVPVSIRISYEIIRGAWEHDKRCRKGLPLIAYCQQLLSEYIYWSRGRAEIVREGVVLNAVLRRALERSDGATP